MKGHGQVSREIYLTSESTSNKVQVRYDAIRDVKIRTPIEELCEGLPNEFAEYLKYVRGKESMYLSSELTSTN